MSLIIKVDGRLFETLHRNKEENPWRADIGCAFKGSL
jgi:hypothetical protein